MHFFVLIHYQLDPVHFVVIAVPWSAIHSNCWAQYGKHISSCSLLHQQTSFTP